MRKHIHASVAELFIQSKTGNIQDCEDLIHISQHYMAVIDGASSKTNKKWDGRTGGRLAAEVIDRAFASLPSSCNARQAADLLTLALRETYRDFGALDLLQADPRQRASAVLAAVSLPRRELWLIGDCQILLGDRVLTRPNRVDEILAEARALFLELDILAGATVDALRRKEAGYQYILPVLERQQLLQNNPSGGEYWYPAVDGFPIPSEGIIVETIPDEISDIVLASDGYPVLKKTLKESEDALASVLLEDPLLFRKHKSTKGVLSGNLSFDDRAYLKAAFES